MAPEMVTKKTHGHAIDTWALGILLYELIHGVEPFKPGNKEQIIINLQKKMKINFKTDLSAEYKDLVYKLLAYQADDRMVLLKVFEHPWVQKYTRQFYPNFEPNLDSSVDVSDSSEEESEEEEQEEEYEYYSETEEGGDDRSGDLSYQESQTPSAITKGRKDDASSASNITSKYVTGIDRTPGGKFPNKKVPVTKSDNVTDDDKSVDDVSSADFTKSFRLQDHGKIRPA